MHSLTSEIITEALFSQGMRPDQHAEIERWLPVMLKGATQRALAQVGLLHRLPTPANRTFETAASRFRQIVLDLISESRARQASPAVTPCGGLRVSQ